MACGFCGSKQLMVPSGHKRLVEFGPGGEKIYGDILVACCPRRDKNNEIIENKYDHRFTDVEKMKMENSTISDEEVL